MNVLIWKGRWEGHFTIGMPFPVHDRNALEKAFYYRNKFEMEFYDRNALKRAIYCRDRSERAFYYRNALQKAFSI